MNGHAMARLAGLLLAVAIGLLAAGGGRGGDDDELKQAKKAQAALIDMVDAMAKGGDGKKEAAAIHDQFDDVKVVMIVFRNATKGGMALGSRGPDGIEKKIQDVDRKRLSKEDAAAQKEDLIRAARFARAVAQVAELYDDPAKKAPAKWKRFNQDMRKGADDLIEAARAGDPTKIKAAVANLHASCTDCHSEFK
jgi:hypothetical protein